VIGYLVIFAVLVAVGSIGLAYFVSRPERANEDFESSKDADI